MEKINNNILYITNKYEYTYAHNIYIYIYICLICQNDMILTLLCTLNLNLTYNICNQWIYICNKLTFIIILILIDYMYVI